MSRPAGRELELLEAATRRALARALPGPKAQAFMAPRPRPGWEPGRIPSDTRPGAALVLFHPRDGVPCVVLTLRAKHLPSHRGQVSFPGGAIETGESASVAALREAHEEIAADPALVRIAGELTSLHIPASGYVLHPVIGFALATLQLEAAAGEVDRILEVPLDHVTDRERWRIETRELRGQPCEVPYFDLAGEKVWGATAIVLCELVWLLGVRCDPWTA